MCQKCCGICHNIVRMVLGTSRCHQKDDGYTVEVARGGHQYQYYTYLRVFLRSSLGGMGGVKGERSEQLSDKAENHHQNWVNSGPFEVQKVRFLIKNALWLYSELCFLCRRGAQFHKNHEKKGWKVKNGAGRP